MEKEYIKIEEVQHYMEELYESFERVGNKNENTFQCWFDEGCIDLDFKKWHGVLSIAGGLQMISIQYIMEELNHEEDYEV